MTREAHLQRCGHLRDLSGSRISHLRLDHCHEVELEKVCNIVGLKHLEISGMKGGTDLSWVARCESLRFLAFYDTRGIDLDVSGLASTTLRKVLLPVEDDDAAEASRLVPGAAVSNGARWFRGGKPGRGRDPLGY